MPSPARTDGLIPTILCACGCGTPAAAFDSRGRPRRYANGHSGGGSGPLDEPRSEFARRLRWLMQHDSHGPLRQVDLARRAKQIGVDGLSIATVNHLVAGKNDPTLGTVRKLARVLDLSVAELLTSEPQPQDTRRIAVLPRAEWTGQRFELTGESIDVTTAVLPDHQSHDHLAVVVSPSANARPLAFEDDLLVVDLEQRQPLDGALVLILIGAQLLLMRAFPEEDGVRFADSSGFVFADSSVCQCEVLAVLSRVNRAPSEAGVQSVDGSVRVLRSVPVPRAEFARL